MMNALNTLEIDKGELSNLMKATYKKKKKG